MFLSIVLIYLLRHWEQHATEVDRCMLFIRAGKGDEVRQGRDCLLCCCMTRGFGMKIKKRSRGSGGDVLTLLIIIGHWRIEENGKTVLAK